MRTAVTFLLAVAFVCALYSVALAFSWFDWTGNAFGWQCAAVAAYFASVLLPRLDT